MQVHLDEVRLDAGTPVEGGAADASLYAGGINLGASVSREAACFFAFAACVGSLQFCGQRFSAAAIYSHLRRHTRAHRIAAALEQRHEFVHHVRAEGLGLCCCRSMRCSLFASAHGRRGWQAAL